MFTIILIFVMLGSLGILMTASLLPLLDAQLSGVVAICVTTWSLSLKKLYELQKKD